MELKELKCPNCGSKSIEIKEKQGICKYCRTTFDLELSQSDLDLENIKSKERVEYAKLENDRNLMNDYLNFETEQMQKLAKKQRIQKFVKIIGMLLLIIFCIGVLKYSWLKIILDFILGEG